MANINILLITADLKTGEAIRGHANRIGSGNMGFEMAENLPSAVERLEKRGIDVVILDLFLEGLSGQETFDKLRLSFNNIPIVVLVDKNRENQGFACIDKGADAFLIKEELNGNLLANTVKYSMERRVLLVEMEQYARELLANEEYFKNLIASNVDSMVVVDKNNNVLFANSAAEIFTEKKAHDMIGKSFEFHCEPGKTIEVKVQHKNGMIYFAEMRVVEIEWEREPAYLASLRDITERKRAEDERIKLIVELQDAITKIKTLSGLLPICAVCKKIRDDSGYWNQIELYLEKHSTAEFSHGICPECQQKLYGTVYSKKDKE